MLNKYIYAFFTAMSILNIAVVPVTTLFHYQWALLLGTLLVYIFANKSSIRCFTIIVILLSSVSTVVMDILGCLFLSNDVFLCCSLVFFSVFSIVNVVISIRLLIDLLVEFAHKK